MHGGFHSCFYFPIEGYVLLEASHTSVILELVLKVNYRTAVELGVWRFAVVRLKPNSMNTNPLNQYDAVSILLYMPHSTIYVYPINSRFRMSISYCCRPTIFNKALNHLKSEEG